MPPVPTPYSTGWRVIISEPHRLFSPMGACWNSVLWMKPVYLLKPVRRLPKAVFTEISWNYMSATVRLSVEIFLGTGGELLATACPICSILLSIQLSCWLVLKVLWQWRQISHLSWCLGPLTLDWFYSNLRTWSPQWRPCRPF